MDRIKNYLYKWMHTSLLSVFPDKCFLIINLCLILQIETCLCVHIITISSDKANVKIIKFKPYKLAAS